jgi:hypothetical protein
MVSWTIYHVPKAHIVGRVSSEEFDVRTQEDLKNVLRTRFPGIVFGLRRDTSLIIIQSTNTEPSPIVIKKCGPDTKVIDVDTLLRKRQRSAKSLWNNLNIMLARNWRRSVRKQQ